MTIRNLIALKTIASKEMVRILRIWPQNFIAFYYYSQFVFCYIW